MNNQQSNKTLGELIKGCREKKNLNQHGLAELVGKEGKSKQWLSSIEQGKTRLQLDDLLTLHEILTDEAERESSLPLWLLKWTENWVLKEQDFDDAKRQRAMTALQKVLVQTGQSKEHGGRPLSLEGFSQGAFEPLTVIYGDRRESPVLTRGDIFSYSFSTTDLMFLPQLGLSGSGKYKTTIRSDKLFALRNEEYIRQEFGTRNLLVVGSPAVNLAARVINNYSVFRFALDPELKEFEARLRDMKELDDRRYLRLFWKMAQDWKSHGDQGKVSTETYFDALNSAESERPSSTEEITKVAERVKQLLGDRSVKSIMSGFRKQGFIDPADPAIHGHHTRLDNDFGVISLARNPFSTDDAYVSILVGGGHGPGTAHALRALGEADFKSHPLGGILEVELDPYLDWPSKFEKATWRWQTGSYDVNKVLNHLAEADKHHALSRLTKEEVSESINFIQNIMGLSPTAAGANVKAKNA